MTRETYTRLDGVTLFKFDGVWMTREKLEEAQDRIANKCGFY